MKKRKSSSYLIISSCHVGMTEEILKVYAQVAKHYKSKVIHLGPTVTDQEKNLFGRLLKRKVNLDSMYVRDLTDAQEEKLDEKFDVVESQIKGIVGIEEDRIKTLLRHFKKVTFVTNDSISISKRDFKGMERVDGGLELTKYLFLSPVPPATPRATRSPITSISVSYLKDCGRSWIVAHPVPSVDCLAKPGLNKAYNYFTVGSLMDQRTPLKTNEQYFYGHMPCAVFVVIDERSGRFFPQQLHIDYLKKTSVGRSAPVVLDDGLMFSATSVREVGASNKATASFDDHAPDQHPGVLGALRALNMLHRPSILINGGDACTFESINRHAEGLPGETEGKRLTDDLSILRRLLDAQANVSTIKKKVLIDSNHHEWITRFVMKNPSLVGMLDWETLSNELLSDWDVIIRREGESEIFYFGDYAIRHGDKEGNVRKAERIFPSGKYLGGHIHRFMAFRRAIQIGCGGKLAPKYTGNQVNAWQNQIASLTKFKGVAAASPKMILHDKKRNVSRFSFRNCVYEVPHHHLDVE